MKQVSVSMNVELGDVDVNEVDTMWWRWKSFVAGLDQHGTQRSVGFAVNHYNYDMVPAQPEDPGVPETAPTEEI